MAQDLPPLVEGSDWLRQWDGVELTLTSHSGPTTEAVAEIVKGFEEATSATVTVLAEPWQNLLSAHLADAAAGGGAYDIVTWPYIWTGHYVESQIVENLNPWFGNAGLLDPRFGMDDIPEAVLEVYGRYRGAASPDPDGLLSIPYKFDVYLAQYRTDLVRQANWQKVGGASPPERRSNRTTFLREPCVGSREGAGEASVAAWMGRAIEHRKSDGPGCRGFQIGRRQYCRRRFGEMSASPAVSENPCTFARLLLGPWEVFKLPRLS